MTDIITHYGGYVLSAFGITGLILAGRKNAWGWLISLCSQAAWATYIIATNQWPLIYGTFAYAMVYAHNFTKWRRDARKPASLTVDELLDVMDDLAYDTPCYIDRFGDCNEHAWFQDTTPGSCPDHRAHNILINSGRRQGN